MIQNLSELLKKLKDGDDGLCREFTPAGTKYFTANGNEDVEPKVAAYGIAQGVLQPIDTGLLPDSAQLYHPAAGLDVDAIARACGAVRQEGVKHDGGKARFDLLPPDALLELVAVFTMGAGKYGDRNWERGMDWGRIFAAMQRHANAWLGGEERDPVDGQHHLASVAWCALVLMAYEKRGVGTDDRAKVFLEDKDIHDGPETSTGLA